MACMLQNTFIELNTNCYYFKCLTWRVALEIPIKCLMLVVRFFVIEMIWLILLSCNFTSSWIIVIIFIYWTDFHEEATFTMTSRGRFKLICDKFEYTKSHSNENTTFWRCVQARRNYCKAKAMTRQFGPKQMVKTYDEHNHDVHNHQPEL